MKQWKEALIRYFSSGIKKENRPMLGLEIEHFIVEKETGKAVPYEGKHGVRRILETLMETCPGRQAYREEDLFGFFTPDFNITLEPAAQFEISIRPLEDIETIGNIYSRWHKNVEDILSGFGYSMMNTGCQPVSRVAEITMIPKRRYALMNQHFAKLGTGGMEMMRGTASVQISIDYTSEADFREKIQAAYYYGPVFKMLCDHSPSFQGKPAGKHLLRTDIWRRTDPSRCGILPDIFSPDYGFSDYADFIGSITPIFLKKGDAIILTGEKKVQEIFEKTKAEDEDILHIISMVFPDVRLKNFLEIRFADSVPLPFILAYCSLIKGLLYSKDGLKYAGDQIRSMHLNGDDIRRAEDDCMKNGWDGDVFGRSSRQQAERMLSLAEQNLPQNEIKYLDAFRKVLNYGSVAAVINSGKEIR